MANFSPKLLVIGLDGATLDLLQLWVDQGFLPRLAQLMQRGKYGRLQSVPNTDTAAAWSTFATGLNPANHGLFHELSWTADRHTLRPVSGADRHGTPFWCIANQHGKRSLIINVPFSYPTQPINGIWLAGIDAPGTNAPHFSYPPDFIQQVPGYRIDSDMQTAIRENRPADGMADAFAVAARRTDAMLQAMAQGTWELAAIVYSIPDIFQHFFWQAMAQGTGPHQYAIRDSYVFIDGQIGRLLAQAGENTNVLVMSDHGFGPLCATPESLLTWLVEQGFTRRLPPGHQSWQKRFISDIYGRLRHTLNESQKATLRRLLPGLRNRVESDARFAGIDWANTTAYAGQLSCEIWINRQGREPHGVVSPGIAYKRLREDIIGRLLAWLDPITGERRIKAVYRAEEVYQGRFQHLAPDITMVWNPTAAPSVHTLPGNVSRFDADHQPEGVVLAAGPGISGGMFQGATLVDVAPTILHLLGIRPDGLDGRILPI